MRSIIEFRVPRESVVSTFLFWSVPNDVPADTAQWSGSGDAAPQMHAKFRLFLTWRGDCENTTPLQLSLNLGVWQIHPETKNWPLYFL
jgi:hypothetical protein